MILLILTALALAGSLSAHITFAGSAESGSGRVQLELTDADLIDDLGPHPDPARFRAIVGSGGARVDAVQPVAGEPIYTVMAFDRSGSFRAGWAQAFGLARVFASAMPTDGTHTVAVMTFHGEQTFHGTATTPDALRALLAEVEAMGTLGSTSETSLMSAVKDGARYAAEHQPTGGARQLIVFSDAGEEGQIFTLDETIAYARSLGCPVHPVVLKTVASAGSSKAKAFSVSNDRMKKLAEETGGRHLHVKSAAQARARMIEHATIAERLWWLQLRYCNVSSSNIRFTDTVQIEVLKGSEVPARTEAAPFRQHAAGAATQSCSALPPLPPPSDASSGADDGDAGSTAAAGDRDWLLPSILGLLGLLGLLGAFLLYALFGRKREEAEDAPPAADPEPPPEPEPVVSPEQDSIAPPPAAWVNPLGRPLPETRLVILNGPPGMEPFYRIHKKPFTIGADASRQLDLLFEVPQISGLHATIELYPKGTMFLTDHSRNGTFVDGRRLQRGERVVVKAGQRIGLSSHVLVQLEQPGLAPAAGEARASHQPPPVAPPDSAPPEPPAASPPQRPQRNATLYGPIDTPAAPPPSASAQPRSRRQKSKTIIQPLRRDDEP